MLWPGQGPGSEGGRIERIIAVVRVVGERETRQVDEFCGEHGGFVEEGGGLGRFPVSGHRRFGQRWVFLLLDLRRGWDVHPSAKDASQRAVCC